MMYRLDVYVPASHLESLKNALFLAGAGKLGNYERCCWQTCGTGQFWPLPGARPFLGEQEKEEHVEEWKLELICTPDCLPSVLDALKKTHPYETPAFQYWQVQTE